VESDCGALWSIARSPFIVSTAAHQPAATAARVHLPFIRPFRFLNGFRDAATMFVSQFRLGRLCLQGEPTVFEQ
jgi:hypothetical protein